MNIAYVTRSMGNKLNGGYSIANYLQKEFGIKHIQVPKSRHFLMTKTYEFDDLLCYKAMADQDWARYDYILYGEYAYAPFFDLLGLKATMLVHSLWTWPDDTACYLEKFLPFVEEAICPTSEVRGLFESKSISNVWLPYPVPDDYFAPYRDLNFRDRPIDVIWVGRAGEHKDPEMMYRIAERMPEYSFMVFSSTDLPKGAPDNVEIKVRASRDECHSSMSKAKVLLMTSNYENYATCLIEGGLSGCAVASREVWGVAHTVPGTSLFKTEDEAAILISYLAASGPTMPREFWVKSFGTSGVRRRWEEFLRGKCK